MAISNLWDPIQQHIDELNERPWPCVHHYTSVTGALGILQSGQMWFSERAHMNDPSEVLHGIELEKAIFYEQGRTDDAECLDHRARGVFRDFGFFSASFSFERDDLSQWRNYAESAFCKPKAYIDCLIKDDPTAFVCPMSYDDARLRRVIEGITEKWNTNDVGELCDHLFMISSMFKNACWKSENEFRFFVHHKREAILKSELYKTRERSGRAISYLDVPIKKWGSAEEFPIWRICLGPAAPDGLFAQFSDFIYSKFPIRYILKSELPYRSVR